MTYRGSRKNTKLATAIRVAIVGVGLAGHSAGQAATIEVTSNLDTGSECTLRNAITSFNNGEISSGCVNTGAAFGIEDTINVAASVASDTIMLTNGALEIAPAAVVSINGNGVTIDANQQSPVFYADTATLSIDDMILTGGARDRYGNGTIYGFDSDVTVTNSTISNNDLSGIRLTDSKITIDNSTISGNSTSSFVTSGGGIYAYGFSYLTVNNSTITGNYAEGSGGGIYFYFASGVINNSTVSDNSAAESAGGIALAHGLSVVINDSTISGNSALEEGGGIFHDFGVTQLTINNTTVSGNSAQIGGGIHFDDQFADDEINIINSTIADNEGGEISVLSESSANIINSIIANSRGGVGNCSALAMVESDNASIIEDGSCGTNARAVDPLLLPLSDNGCTVRHTTPNGLECVMTHALAEGSPAIDTAVNADLETDQRGIPRPQGAAADVGAFEFSSFVPTAPGFSVTVAEAVEGRDSEVVFTITLDEQQAVLASYDFSTQAGSAIDGEDYVGRVGRLLFPAGETVLTLGIDVLEDGGSNENDETFSLVVTDVNNSAATLTTQATIRDIASDGSLPELSVEVVKVQERSGLAVIAIELSKPSTERVLVDFSTVVPRGQLNPATGGVDFVEQSGRITFVPGETRQVRIIKIIDDVLDEANEVFRFKLSKPRNAEIAPGSEQQRVFIMNDDPLPQLSVERVQVEEGSGPAVVTIELSKPSAKEVLVDFSTFVPPGQLNPATGGVDFIEQSGQIVFAPGETKQVRRITIIDDDLDEANEVFRFKLSEPINAEIASGNEQRRIFIRNGKILPKLSVRPVSVREGSGPAVVTIELSKPSTQEVSVDFSTVVPRFQLNPATGGVDYVEQTGRITFAPGETTKVRRVTIIDDDVTEANEVFRFELSNQTNAELVLGVNGNSRQRVFILNDD